MLGLFGGLGGGEILLLLAVALLFFGAKKLPELAKGMGSALTEFKKGMSGEATAERPQAPTPKETPKEKQGV